MSESARQDHPQIPWQQIIGLRNVLVHEYDEIQHDILWKITTEDIPPLIEALELIVPPPPDEPTT